MPVVRRTRTIGKAQRGLLRALFLFLLIVLAVYFFFQSSFFNVTRVDVRNNAFLTSVEIKQLANVPLGANIFKIDENRIKQNLLLHPLVKDVKISREFPDTIIITMVERKPLLLIPSEQGFLELDETGIYLKKVSTISDVALPIVTGVKIPPNVGPGQVIVDPKLAQALEFLSKVPEEKRKILMEIEIKDHQQFLVYTPEGIEVRFGSGSEVEQKLKLLEQIMQDGKLAGKAVEYIDLSTVATPVVKYSK